MLRRVQTGCGGNAGTGGGGGMRRQQLRLTTLEQLNSAAACVIESPRLEVPDERTFQRALLEILVRVP
jgi:hypothetical protein